MSDLIKIKNNMQTFLYRYKVFAHAVIHNDQQVGVLTSRDMIMSQD